MSSAAATSSFVTDCEMGRVFALLVMLLLFLAKGPQHVSAATCWDNNNCCVPNASRAGCNSTCIQQCVCQFYGLPSCCNVTAGGWSATCAYAAQSMGPFCYYPQLALPTTCSNTTSKCTAQCPNLPTRGPTPKPSTTTPAPSNSGTVPPTTPATSATPTTSVNDTQPTGNSTSLTSSSGSLLDIGGMIGISVGILIVVVVICCILIFCAIMRTRMRRRAATQNVHGDYTDRDIIPTATTSSNPGVFGRLWNRIKFRSSTAQSLASLHGPNYVAVELDKQEIGVAHTVAPPKDSRPVVAPPVPVVFLDHTGGAGLPNEEDEDEKQK